MSAFHSAADINRKEAEQTAQEVEQELKGMSLEQDEQPATLQEKEEDLRGPGEGTFEETEKLLECWRARISALEEKGSKSSRVAPPSTEDASELQSIAEEVAKYRQQLIDDCGYRKKDLREDPDLPELEARLDKLSETILPAVSEPEKPSLKGEEEELLGWAQAESRRLAEKAADTSNLSPSENKEVEQLVTQIIEWRAKLGAEGLTQHELDKHEEVLKRMIRLRELRLKDRTDKKHDGRLSHDKNIFLEEVEQLRKSIDEHKYRLREEKGLSQKELSEDQTLSELEERYRTLCQVAGA